MSRYPSARVVEKRRAERDVAYRGRLRDVPVRWTSPEGDLVVDLRNGRLARRSWHSKAQHHHVQVSPDRRCEVHMRFCDTGTALTLVVDGVNVNVLMARENRGDDWLWDMDVPPWLMPGLRGAMGSGMWTWDYDAVIHGRYEDLGVRAVQAWAHVPVVHAALSDPARWWAGVRRIPGTDGLIHLAGWASIGVTSARDARDWAGTGLRPTDVVNWRASGWDDQGLRVWATDGAGWDPKVAAAFKAAGVPQVYARSWLVNALALHPRTAGRLHAAGWSPTGTSQVRKALKTADRSLAFAGLTEQSMAGWSGDQALERWAATGVNAPVAVTCIQAGLSVSEVRDMLAEGRFDRRVARVMAALAA